MAIYLNTSGVEVTIPSAAVADLSAQTITIGPALLTGAADGDTTQTAITNLVNKINALMAALRAAGIVTP